MSPDFMAIPAIAGIIAAWNTLKEIFAKIIGVVFITVQLSDNDLYMAFWYYCKNHAKRISWRSLYKPISPIQYIRTLRCYGLVCYDRILDPVLWRLDGKLLLIWGERAIFLRGSFNAAELIGRCSRSLTECSRTSKLACARYRLIKKIGSLGRRIERDQKEEVPRAVQDALTATSNSGLGGLGGLDIDMRSLYDIMGFEADHIGLPLVSDRLANMVLNEAARRLVERLRVWIAHREWYEERGLPWKHGVLLHGAPGTGKTALVRALAQELNMPIIQFHLATMTDHDLIEAWDSTMCLTPAVMLFEDIDTIFQGRKNVATTGKNETGVTFSCFLNVIDGVDNTDGALVCITTNTIEAIDPALGRADGDGMATRPGRIDQVVEMPALDRDGKLQIAARILRDIPVSVWGHLIDDAPLTPAQFQEQCSRIAMVYISTLIVSGET